LKDFANPRRERFRRLLRNQKSSVAIGDDFRNSSYWKSNHWNAGGKSLQQHARHAFGCRWNREQIQLGQH